MSADNQRQLWIPEGFAHGFVVVSDSADVLYKATDYYCPEGERCVAWDDARVGIRWPICEDLLLSEKDKLGVLLDDAEIF